MDEYDGRQFVGIDLHRRRSVIVRMTPEGERLGRRCGSTMTRSSWRRQVASWGESPEVVLEATYGWYWAADVLAEAGANGASGASVGGEGFRLPAGEERRTRRRGSGRSAADGPAARGVDRPARGARAAGAGPAPVQAGRAALRAQGPGPRGAGQAGRAGARCRICSASAGRSCSTSWRWTRRFRARVLSLRRLIDAFTSRSTLWPSAISAELPSHRGLPGGPGHPRGRAGAGGGVRGRDRRRDPLHPARSSCAPGPG